MTVSKFVAFLSWTSFFVSMWICFRADTITPFQWFVIAASFAVAVIAGAWQMGARNE
jgi:hypothetical protein